MNTRTLALALALATAGATASAVAAPDLAPALDKDEVLGQTLPRLGAEPTQPARTASDLGFALRGGSDEPSSFTRSYDSAIESLAQIITDSPADREYLVVFAGAVKQDGKPRTDVRARALVLTMPAGVAVDLAVGQHVHGTAEMHGGDWNTTMSLDLADDRGPVLVVNAPSIAHARGPRVHKWANDEAFEERHAVTATIPGAAQPVQLDGWQRRGGFALFGTSVALAPDAQVNDWFDLEAFVLARIPAQPATAAQLTQLAATSHTVLAIAITPGTFTPGAGSPSVHPRDTCSKDGKGTKRTYDVKVARIVQDGAGSYEVDTVGTVREGKTDPGPRARILDVSIPAGVGLDLKLGAHLTGSDACTHDGEVIDLRDDVGELIETIDVRADHLPTWSLGRTPIAAALGVTRPPGGSSSALTEDRYVDASWPGERTPTGFAGWALHRVGAVSFAGYGRAEAPAAGSKWTSWVLLYLLRQPMQLVTP